jgi:hypothetical protein
MHLESELERQRHYAREQGIRADLTERLVAQRGICRAEIRVAEPKPHIVKRSTADKAKTDLGFGELRMVLSAEL